MSNCRRRYGATSWSRMALTGWIGYCALLQVAGWALSAVGQLNARGYVAVLALATVAAVLVCRRRAASGRAPSSHLPKLLRRFRRRLPLAFAVVAVLAAVGGLLHAPSNYDGLTYRIPRVLHWLAADRWHWVSSDFPRLNPRGCGWEWVAAPVIALLKTDRPLFLLNVISFLMLPGLVFSVLSRLGVRRRVAWHWMWVLPTGYCYLLQAGSIGNDLFGATFALAAVHFALRARQSQRPSDFWWSVLAAALATGVKSSNLLLGLPWLAAAGPALKHLFVPRVPTLLLALAAVLCSAIPISLLNVRYCGDWSGQVLENAAMGGAPAVRLPVNTLWLALRHVAPPVFPWAGTWNDAVQHGLPAEWKRRLEKLFEPAEAGFRLGELESEEGAGLGFGVCVFLMLSWLAARRTQSPANRKPLGRPLSLVTPAAWLAVLLFMSQSGLSAITRLLAPFYVLLCVPILRGAGHAVVIRRRLWRSGAFAVFALGALLLALNPARPLWPATTCLRLFGAENSAHPLVRRAWAVYSTYQERPRAFEPVLRVLPRDANPLGFITFDDPETSLWRPFGSRRIVHVRRSDVAQSLRDRSIRYVLVGEERLRVHFGETLTQLQTRLDAEVLAQLTLRVRAGRGPEQWYLLRVRDASGPRPSESRAPKATAF